MSEQLRIFSLWAIDDLSDIDICRKQLCNMAELGFCGVVFHPRRYSGHPAYLGTEYMEKLSELILYAKSISMEFWLYDENGWPSGSANGGVLKALPDMQCKWIEYDGKEVSIKSRTGVNSIDRRSVEKFVELTHEGYKKGLQKEAFDYVGGFFSDEVGFLEGHGACMDRGGIPWSEEIAELYEKQFGAEIYDELPKLFSSERDRFKVWYWEALTKLLADSFYSTIERWCRSNGKLFTAHLKGEENPLFQIGYSGSCFSVLKKISVPGLDALERRIGNAYYLHIASSLAKQFGSGIAMAEVLGGAGWGLTPADFAAYTDKLIDCGTNMFVFHINQLHLSYDGITDWPSSIPCHQPWRGIFPELIARMRERARKVREADTLLIVPVRGTMSRFSPELVLGMNEHDGTHQMISEASMISRRAVEIGEQLFSDGIGYHVTDEKTFEENAGIRDGKICLGNGEYRRVIIVTGCEFSEKGRKLLDTANCRYDTEWFSPDIRQSAWRIIPPEKNRYFVEIRSGEGYIDIKYLCECELLVSDQCVVSVNGKTLVCEGRDEYGFRYALGKDLLMKGRNTVELNGTEKAFVYVIGSFAVKNRKPFYDFDSRQYETENGFYMAEPDKAECDLTCSGWPFCTEPVVFTKRLTGKLRGNLHIDCSYIAAGQVFVNGKNCGWIYSGSETIPIDIQEEECELKCVVYQTAYNIYGPHHHLEGDRTVVSPMQYTGEKNFADTAVLPNNTFSEKMKLVKWRMAENVKII